MNSHHLKLQEIAQKLEIKSYATQMNDIIVAEPYADIISPQKLSCLEERYNLLKDYYPMVQEAIIQLRQDKIRLYWANTCAAYFSICNDAEAARIIIPKSNGTLAGDFLPLLILLTDFENGIKKYREYGMDAEMIIRNIDHFYDGIKIVEHKTGRPGIDQVYFTWLSKFVKAQIFNAYGFNFQITNLPGNVVILKDTKTQSLIPLIHSTTCSNSGLILNTNEAQGATDIFMPTFFEDDGAYYGHRSDQEVVNQSISTFPKNRYECFLNKNDPVISVHIPRGTNISPEIALQAMTAGFIDASKYYPDHHAKALCCRSWLLDPALKKIMDKGAKIPQFGELFTRYPCWSSGQEVFSFVFPRKMPLHLLPENTSLERSLKKYYIDGNSIRAYCGILLPDLKSGLIK